MKITALKLLNYKGFLDSGFVELSESWNVIVGQNNAGKTAFIEGFRLGRNDDKPHRNITFPRDFPFTASRFLARMLVSREWLKNCWLRQGGHFELPSMGMNSQGHQVIVDPNTFWGGADLDVELEFVPRQSAKSKWPSHRLFESIDGQQRFVQILLTADRRVGPVNGPFGGTNDTLPEIVQANYPSRIYVFEAKRFAVGECGHEDTALLKPDASNLPAVLIKLMGNPNLFQEFNRNVNTIFPNIKEITVSPKGNNFEIRIWSIDPATRRDDLAVPLNESGTGVGQVLAILYVAMTNEPGVIAIDEPNSFLHPGAAKKLIQILKRYPQHQYIISTHSPEVISAAQPAKLHLVKFDGQKSVIESFNEKEIEVQRMMLEEVGASLSDIFSAERVIWVEGPTERECFELIATSVLNKPGLGQSFVALRNTGDLDGKQADAAIEIYEALTKGGSILPVSVCFSFDSEGKSQKQIEDLRRRCGGRAKFLPRKMTENYLLNPAAITAVLKTLGEETLETAQVRELLQKYAPKWMRAEKVADFGTDEFFIHVDGAKLLMDVFSYASDTRHSYRKVRHGVELLKIILKEDRESVVELIEFVDGLIS